MTGGELGDEEVLASDAPLQFTVLIWVALVEGTADDGHGLSPSAPAPGGTGSCCDVRLGHFPRSRLVADLDMELVSASPGWRQLGPDGAATLLSGNAPRESAESAMPTKSYDIFVQLISETTVGSRPSRDYVWAGGMPVAQIDGCRLATCYS